MTQQVQPQPLTLAELAHLPLASLLYYILVGEGRKHAVRHSL